ncbi:MAG: hypothetical protein ACLFN5_01170 [bacterium]
MGSKFAGLKQLVLLLTVLLLLGGCATQTQHYTEIIDSVETSRYDEAVALVEKAREDNVYKKKDRVLYSLELGLALHYAGNFELSNRRLAMADDYITELFTRRISEIGFSFLSNDNQLPYPGEPYEDIYLNVFKALNYAGMQDKDAVFVEVRKIDEKLSYMRRRYEALAEDYQSASLKEFGDTIDFEESEKKPDFEPGNSEFHTSALGRYLGYITRLAAEERDGARIDLEKMKEAFLNQPGIYNFDFPDKALPPRQSIPLNKARVNFLALLGRGPSKKQVDERFKYKDYYVKFSFPVLEPGGTNISRVEIYDNTGKYLTKLAKLEDVNRVAQNVFSLSAPLAYSKAIVRGIAKGILGREVRKKAGNPWVSLLSLLTQEISEQADLRTTRLLPAEFHVGHLIVPANKETTLELRYYSENKLIDVKKITMTFQHDDANIVEVNKLI